MKEWNNQVGISQFQLKKMEIFLLEDIVDYSFTCLSGLQWPLGQWENDGYSYLNF